MTAIRALRKRLRDEALAQGGNPRDADLLLADALGVSLTALVSRSEDPVPDSIIESITAMLARRRAGEPLQYVRGMTEFYGRSFRVDPRVLIPRPETELLVEAALARIRPGARVLDVGTGSGCIAISIGLERPDATVFALDRSVAALALARFNNEALQANVRFLASDVLSSVRSRFDLIVSNPPYIPRADIAGLQIEVREWEPHAALTSGPAGTEIIERLVDQARNHIHDEGAVMMEIGYGQEREVSALAEHYGWTVDRVINDLAGIPRIIVLSGGRLA